METQGKEDNESSSPSDSSVSSQHRTWRRCWRHPGRRGWRQPRRLRLLWWGGQLDWVWGLRARPPARRGQRQVNQVRGGQGARFGQDNQRATGYTAPGKSGPSRSSSGQPRAGNCFRCGESSHLAGSCRKFNMFHSERCPHCASLNPSGQAIFHPLNLCPYVKDGTSNYRSPRARSPVSWQTHGFDSKGKANKGKNWYWLLLISFQQTMTKAVKKTHRQ